MAFRSDSGGAYSYEVRNAGVGPALVRYFRVRVDGVPRHNWGEVIRSTISPPVAVPPGTHYSPDDFAL